MSKEVSNSSVPIAEAEVGSNFLALCIREAEELLSQKEDFVSYLDSKNSKSFTKPCIGVENNNFYDGKDVVKNNVSGTLFCDSIGDGLSSIQKERLKASSKQSVSVISQEVDEILNSVLTMSKLKKQLKQKEKTPNNLNSSDSDGRQSLCKKQKLSTSPSLTGSSTHAGSFGTQSSEEVSDVGSKVKKDSTVVSTKKSPSGSQRICVECNATSTPQWRWRRDDDQVEPQIFCNACWCRNKKKRASSLVMVHKNAGEKLKPEIEADTDESLVSTEKIPSGSQRICVECNATSTPQWRRRREDDQVGPQIFCDACWCRNKKKRESSLVTVRKNAEEKLKPEMEADTDESLRIFLDIGGLHTKAAEETMKRHSDELFTKLGHMELQLEKYLDVITSKCRKMTKTEKWELCKLIRDLPPKNLDRVVEIILQHRKPPNEHPSDEVRVDLEREENVTLWRIYYYVEAVARASKCVE